MQVVRNSTNPEIKESILATLHQRADEEAEKRVVKSSSVHEEVAKV